MQDSLDPRDVVRQPATDAARPAQQAEPTAADHEVTPPGTELPSAVHAYLAKTPCALRLLQADDLAGESVALNLPGTDRERDNWRRRVRVKSADLWS